MGCPSVMIRVKGKPGIALRVVFTDKMLIICWDACNNIVIILHFEVAFCLDTRDFSLNI